MSRKPEGRREEGIPQAKGAEWLQGLVLWRKSKSHVMSPFPGKPFDAVLNEIGRDGIWMERR